MRRPRRSQPLAVDRDTTLECDVCVVGSGAGGGTAAGVLAAAGLDVVVLEAGDYYDDEDFDGAEFDGYGRMYMYGGGAATHDQSVGLLAGRCLGGGRRSTTRRPSGLPTTCARSGRRTACRPSRATSTAQPRRGLRAPGREPGAQRAVGARAGAAARA